MKNFLLLKLILCVLGIVSISGCFGKKPDTEPQTKYASENRTAANQNAWNALSATDYFHIAANYYANFKKKSAQAVVKEGIEKFPDDQKLKNLASKIDELPDAVIGKGPDIRKKYFAPEVDPDEDEQSKPKDEQNKAKDEIQQINIEDALRILETIAHEEKELQEKLKQKESHQETEKNW